MSRWRLRRPSPAMVVALLALLVALGGTAGAAARFGPFRGDRVIVVHSLSGNRLKNHTITGLQVNLGKLGKVPNAANADTAGSAGHANVATTATNAQNAAHATNADQLGGQPPSAFHDRCPSGTTMAAADLCVTTSNVGTGGSGENTWDGALKDCAALGMRLPTPAEAMLLVSTTPATASGGTTAGYWTDDFYWNGTTYVSLLFAHATNPSGDVYEFTAVLDAYVRCVTTPSNS
jgi:hypothetical protein